jgi:nucleoside-diphosphate-sugar epimerase
MDLISCLSSPSDPRVPRSDRQRCGAKTRKGTPCQAPAVWDKQRDKPINGRCKRCNKDLVDVVSALLAMSCHSAPIGIFNVGTGLGTPITRILTVLADLLGHKLESRTSVDLVRPSEPHCLIADTRHSNRLLNWTAKYDLRDGLEEYLREEDLV